MKKPSISSVNESILTEEEEYYQYPSDYTDDFEEYTSRDDSQEMIKNQVLKEKSFLKQSKKHKKNNDSSFFSQEESLLCVSIQNSKSFPAELSFAKQLARSEMPNALTIDNNNNRLLQKKTDSGAKRPIKPAIPEGFRSPYIEKKSKSKHSQETTASNTLTSIAEERETQEQRNRFSGGRANEIKPKTKEINNDSALASRKETARKEPKASLKAENILNKGNRNESAEPKISIKLKNETAFEFFNRLYPNFPEVTSPINLDNPIKKQRESANQQTQAAITMPFVYENEKLKKIYTNNQNIKLFKIKRQNDASKQEMRNPQSAPCLNDFEDDLISRPVPEKLKRPLQDSLIPSYQRSAPIEKREIAINNYYKKLVNVSNILPDGMVKAVEGIIKTVVTETGELSATTKQKEDLETKIKPGWEEKKKSISGRDFQKKTIEIKKDRASAAECKNSIHVLEPLEKNSKPLNQSLVQASPLNPSKVIPKTDQKPRLSYILPDSEDLSKITAQGWAIVERKTFQLISGKNIHKKKEIASLTKMMTCMVTCQISRKLNLNLDQTFFQISRHASNMVGTSAELREGDIVSITDLLYGLMLPSGNDAAYSLAENFGLYLYQEALNGGRAQQLEVKRKTNVEYFVEEMNDQAKKLKMYNTFFANSHGLTNEQNRSTPYDIARLSIHILQDEAMCTIVNKKYHKTKVKESCGGYRECCWENTNKLLFHEGIYGIKTGNTDTAGACLSTSYKRKDLDIVVVVLGCSTREDRFDDTLKVIDWYNKKKQALKQQQQAQNSIQEF